MSQVHYTRPIMSPGLLCPVHYVCGPIMSGPLCPHPNMSCPLCPRALYVRTIMSAGPLCPRSQYVLSIMPIMPAHYVRKPFMSGPLCPRSHYVRPIVSAGPLSPAHYIRWSLSGVSLAFSQGAAFYFK